MITFHKDGITPTGVHNLIFVFGSNLAGRHGRGAAKAAHDYFGAQYGRGIGWVGDHAYAIPTKDENLVALSLPEIERYVREFMRDTVRADTKTLWFVTRVGCGLAGNTDAEIAPMFRPLLALRDSVNVSFADTWRPYLTP